MSATKAIEWSVALLFVAGVGAFYCIEFGLILRCIGRKIRKAERGSGILRPGAVAMHCIAIAGLLCMAWGYFVEPYRLEVTRIELQTPKLKSARLRIVQVSDLHCGSKAAIEPKLPPLVNALRPDLIVFTGDACNSEDGIPLMRQTLCNMEAPMGKFLVRGNFDQQRFCGDTLFDGTGFQELLARTAQLQKEGEKLCLTGVPYHGDGWRLVLPNIPRDSFSIVLCHKPDLVEDVAGQPVDLYLCGHTHGGQVALPFYGALITLSRYGKRYEAGRYDVGGMIVYVNRGIGMESFPAPRVRFCARPEITVFDVIPSAAMK